MKVLLTASQRQSAKSIHQDFKKEKPLPFIEITSDKPGSGKTHLLYHIIAVAILPLHFNGVLLHGKDSTIVFLDTDLRFDICRLSQVIRSYIIQRAAVDGAARSGDVPYRQDRIASNDIDKLIAEVVKHVHVIQQWSMDGLLENLEKLPHYLLMNSNHYSAKRHLHAILIDSVSAFYWESRMENNVKGNCATLDTGMSYTKTSYMKLARLLRRLQASFACMVVTTSWSYRHFNPTHAVTPESQSWKSILPNSWSRLPIVRIAVEHQAPASSQLHLRDLDHAAAVVSNSLKIQKDLARTNFAASLDESYFEDLDDHALNDLRQTRGAPSFMFTITKTGLYT